MALSYVRTLELQVSRIKVLFNDDIDENVGVGNVVITSGADSIANPDVRSVSIDNDVMDITFSPLFPNVQYKITFKSTSSQNFQTVNGEIISEDGRRNAFFFTSPGEEENAIRDAMFDDLSTVYEVGEPTLVRSLVTAMADQFQKSSDAIETTRAANYLSVLVKDEVKTRGDGPIDRLKNGGAFEILRVASNPTQANSTTYVEFNQERALNFKVRDEVIVNSVIASLTSDPISLQATDVINEKVTDDIKLANHFSGLTIKVSKSPVIQVISVSLLRNGVYTEYNIEKFGYTLRDNRYDTTSGSINVNLTDNEIELSSGSLTGLDDGFLLPKAGDEIYVSYVYKKLGRDVDPDGVQLSRIRDVVRERVPAIINSFSLEHAPIVNQFDEIYRTGGVEFLNTQASDGAQAFTTVHPAFTKEIPYDITKLPVRAGEYTINYNTGDVLVYGQDINNDGTGENAPVANYSYREIFIPDLDYTFNSDRDELSINSTRGLAFLEAKITFDYEDTFAAGTDYNIMSHVEVLNERVNNKLVSEFKLQTDYYPVSDAFRILNETTGELYNIVRFSDTTITFSGRKAPRQRDVEREQASFDRVSQEVLLVSDELENTGGLRIFKVNLQNNGITNSQARFIGSNFDTSMLFSKEDLFVREFFYEDRLFDSVTTNLDRLESVGDYMVDYNNGIVYVAVTTDQGTDLGDTTYQHKKIATFNRHILGVNNIYRSRSALESNVTTYRIGDVEDTTVSIIGLEQVGERFINNNPVRPLLVGTYQSGEDGITVSGGTVFTSNSGIFTANDVGRSLIVGASSQPPVQEVTITGIVNDHEVTVTPAFTYTKKGRVWAIVDLSEGAAKTITLGSNIVSVNNIYSVGQIGTLPASDLDGYFDINRDSISGNVITLGASNPLSVGDAVMVHYNPGNLYIDYRYLMDELVVSYEYGHNSLDLSISSTLSPGEQYYVTYKYGALREPLTLNFGALTQIPQLTKFSPNLDREVYRSILSGTLQSFIEGPTVPSLERLVESFTDVTPNISEAAFNNWVLGRDKLNLRKPTYNTGQLFDLGRFDNGVVLSGDRYVSVPALAHFKLKEGTLEAWIRPEWKGLANDSTLTFDGLGIDGYVDPKKVFIGFAGRNPTSIPFTLSVNDETLPPGGEPTNILSDTGYFIWFDEFDDLWHMRWRDSTVHDVEFGGTITTTGEFFNVVRPTDNDGYELNEITDVITSRLKSIDFTAFIDGYDAATSTSGYAMDGISFASGDTHYIFDMAEYPAANRVSLFKDGTGYLNFQVYDNRGKSRRGNAGMYNISTNIRDWLENSLHHVAVGWKFNSADNMDEMHLFVDGAEVPNLFKYGGNPKANGSYFFGGVAEEVVISSALRPIVGGIDGVTVAGSNLFRSPGSDFTESGIQVGDKLYLLDDTADGIGDPNFGLYYTVTGVGTTTVTVDRAMTLSLGDLHFTVNSVTATVDTHINFQDFMVVTIDMDGNETELFGIDAENPDYLVRRGADNSHVIEIYNRVELGDAVFIKPLGLLVKRCRDRVYVYDGAYDEIKFNGPPPVTLGDVDIKAVILDRTLISAGGGFGLVGTIIGAQLVTMLQSYFDNVCQPSNNSAGRKLAVKLSGDNFNYNIPGNQVIIEGTTYSGAIKETLTFVESDTIVTGEYWTHIDSITVSVIPIDATQPVGSVEITENSPLTVSENNGDFAEVVEYSNGLFRLETYGTAGQPFILNGCTYEIDYPAYLSIRIDGQPDSFFIGSDYNGENKFDGIIDEVRILDFLAEDTRAGETLAIGESSITTDYNKTQPFQSDANTLLLMHFDDTIEDTSVYRDRFDSGFEVATSVNADFGTSIRFDGKNPYVITNAGSIFDPTEGTIEFWVSPMNDTRGDPNYHYYVDMTAVVEETLESTSSLTLATSQRIRNIESVRLVTDVYNTGTNYYTGGSVSNVDYKTITLGIPLPAQNVQIKVVYVPLDNKGDRVSIFRDPVGRINFFVKANDVEHLITVPVSWEHNTWHRVMVMWKMNSPDNQDRLRLFVDGAERGTIRYGTGLIYGTGVIYGQEEVRSGTNRFLVDNIDLTDTFARIYIGSDAFSLKSARARMDNIRFSEVQRLQAIKVTSTGTMDINWSANTEFAIPVVEDLYTTKLLDFDSTEADVEYLATIVNAERGIFRFKIEVIDSFDKVIGNTELEELLVDLINTIKPAHTEAIISFVE